MALVLIVFGSVWPVLLQSMYGVHQVDPVARDVAHAYQFRRRETIWGVVLPSAAPFVATGIRIAATMSLLLAVGAELIGDAPGLGQSISVAEQNGQVPQMYAYIVVSAVLGVLINLALLRLERRTLRWHAAHRSLVAE
jgi:ABC-type nitrate/sulfonate/bicarbonate transport system permease component